MPALGTSRKKDRVKEKPIVLVNTSVSGTIYDRLLKMRKAKGMMHDQELVRLFISEGLERAGF